MESSKNKFLSAVRILEGFPDNKGYFVCADYLLTCFPKADHAQLYQLYRCIKAREDGIFSFGDIVRSLKILVDAGTSIDKLESIIAGLEPITTGNASSNSREDSMQCAA